MYLLKNFDINTFPKLQKPRKWFLTSTDQARFRLKLDINPMFQIFVRNEQKSLFKNQDFSNHIRNNANAEENRPTRQTQRRQM